MQIYKYPQREQWKELLQRPVADFSTIEKAVSGILQDVKKNGDIAVKKYALQFDKAERKDWRVSKSEIKEAINQVDAKLKQAIKTAYKNIRQFHLAQKVQSKKVETTKGVVCWREDRAIENVGLYIPGGSAPLFSTVLMLAIPAQIAGCKRIVLCTPSDKNGQVHPAVLFAAQLCGVDEIYAIGGVQAIGALTYGTNTIEPVYKIFGPGNQYVTLAKQLAQKEGVAIDMPAGPSEVLVVGDDSADVSFIAADLLSQAEHGADSQVVFVTFKEKVAREVMKEIGLQLKELPRQQIAQAALQHSKIILVKNDKEAVELINAYAPEHLILAVRNEKYYLRKVENAGSVFIGNYSPESAGDYASGTNHTLPTNGYARAYSGVSLDSFVKKITYQKISAAGIQKLGGVIEQMAEAESLHAHKNAVSIRLKKLKSRK